ncbi:DUF4310 family protein [Spiroplasma sp. DGKH1]|uniref:DUF4310 family protein n=1 Tax=Spiroplasma sp. DGKH1 TaxID=3050074 RepID=UPI0034C5CA17
MKRDLNNSNRLQTMINKTDKIKKQLLIYETQITTHQNKLQDERDFNKRLVIRNAIKSLKKNIRQLKAKTLSEAEILKTEYEFQQENVLNAQKNLEKVTKHYQKISAKWSQAETLVKDAKAYIKDYKQNYSEIKSKKKIIQQYKILCRKNEKLKLLLNNLTTKETILTEKQSEVTFEQETFLTEHVNVIKNEYDELLNNAEPLNSGISKELLLTKLQEIDKINNKKIAQYNARIKKYQVKIEKITNRKINLQHTLDHNLTIITTLESENIIVGQKLSQYAKSKKVLLDNVKLKWEFKKTNLYYHKVEHQFQKANDKLELLAQKINLLANVAGQNLESINSKESNFLRGFNRLERILLKDWFFIIITMMLSAGVVLSTYLFVQKGIGALNEIFVVAMLKNGLVTGDYTAAMGFAVGFLIARILEGPLVGILDVGGSILTGVGIGVPAVFLASNKLAFVMHNPFLALLLGAVIGMIIGVVIILIRILKPKEAKGLGTDIMIGAGNATGKFLGPLVIFSAATFNPLAGIGAGIGAGIFMWIKKPLVGGAILGAMILGMVPAFS